MSTLSEILDFNKEFVKQHEYEQYRTDRFPDKRMVILTCMDTRLLELLPRAMNLRNGDVKIIKTAGAVVSHPFGSIMRSILVAIYELAAQEILIIGHHDCGMLGFDCGSLFKKARERGISDDTFNTLEHAGIDLAKWLAGFSNVRDGISQSVQLVRQHPLLPKDVPVHGLVIHPETGQLEWIANGYEKR